MNGLHVVFMCVCECVCGKPVAISVSLLLKGDSRLGQDLASVKLEKSKLGLPLSPAFFTHHIEAV